MKSFTDITQSKKLAEFLPIESADMHYWCGEELRIGGHKAIDADYDIPCWSLAALMEVIKEHDDYTLDICFGGYEGEKYVREWCCTYEQDIPPYNDILSHAENVIDACVEMVIKLHELHLL